MIPIAIAFFILAQITAADWAGYAALLTIVAKVIADWINRRQDRLDKESDAAIVLSELKAQELRVRIAAAEREGRIVAKIDENTLVNQTALDAANGNKAVIAESLKSVAEAAEVIKAAAPEKLDKDG